MGGITLSLDAPYWEAPANSSPEARAFPVSIDGTGYLIDLTANAQRSSIAVSQQRPDVGTGDGTLLPGDVWRAERESWHQGDRQAVGDRDDSQPYRFATSRGVDVWDKWQVSLLHDVVSKVSVTASNPWVGVVNGQLAVVEGTNLRWYADAGAAAVTRVLAAAAVSVATSGNVIYIACADGVIYSCTAGGTPASFLSLSGVTWIGWFKDFLIAATTNVLYNVTTGTAVTIRTHPLTAFRWVDGCEGLSCIYLIGGSGDRWVVHRVGIDDTGTILTPPIVASMLPDGEVGKALGSYMGYVFVGTDKGMRFGAPQASGDLTLGPLITTPAAVRCFEGQDRFVWFGLSNYVSGATGLGRVDLTTFTDPLAPASAPDLTAPVTGEVTSVTTWLGRTVFAVASGAVYVESATDYVASGYLVESDITFGVPDVKNAHYAQVRTKPLSGSVTLDFAYDGKDYVTVARVSDPGAVGSGNRFLNGDQFETLSARLTLTRDSDPTKTPVVTRWEIRGEPVTGKGSQWQIPVLITADVEVDGTVRSRNPDIDRERLIALVGDGTVVTYREGNVSWQVHMADYVWKPTHQNQQGSFEGVLTLIAREVK